jgi:hypothetical protein
VLLGVGDADAGGLLLRRGGHWQAITPTNSTLPSPLVHEIEVGGDASFWVASAQFQGNGGLSRVVAGEVTSVFDRARTGLLYNWVVVIAVAGDHVWLGFAAPIYDEPDVAEGGIQELQLGRGVPDTLYPADTRLISNRVRSLVWSKAGELWFTTSVDANEGRCRTCVSGIGVIDTARRFHILSSLNADIAPNEFLPYIREAPDGTIHVARAERGQIVKVVR